MKFIVNTAVDPHFCALFDEQGKRIAYHEWEDRRRDGNEIWEFLNPQEISEFTFIGGVSGPGGFSSLRAGAGVLNSVAFATQLPVHSLRADFWQHVLLNGKGAVVLNSFGDAVWLREGTHLMRHSAAEAGASFGDTPACTSWLPEEKKIAFKNAIDIDLKNAPEVLLELLEKTDAYPQFVTEYEVPPIG